MPALPTDWSALLAVVFALGLRHGIDADHIASIDALTRLQRSARGRWCGAWFALGHGAVVLAVVGAVALASRRWQPPDWLAPLGSAMSITLLAALGAANLRACWQAPASQPVLMCGLRGRWLRRCFGTGDPRAAAGVGALFALSLDTLTLAAMFALSGRAAGGTAHALALGAVFAGGMLVSDGANGLWLSRLIERGTAAAGASRLTAAVVGSVSLAVAALGAARWWSPVAAAWVDRAGPALGVGLLLAVACSAAWLGRRASSAGVAS